MSAGQKVVVVLARYEAERASELAALRGLISAGAVSRYEKELADLAEWHREAVEARAAVAALIEVGEKLLPRNLCLNNPRWPDSTEIPLTTTLGELRAFAAALANVGGAA